MAPAAAGRGPGDVLYSGASSKGRNAVKLVLFQAGADGEVLPGLITDRGVVDISGAVKKGHTPQLTMQGIIDDFDRLRPALEKLAADGKAMPAAQVRLKPPLPRPGKILCCIANYWEHAQREARPLNMFMKNPDAVIGPGDTIMLPEYTVPWVFMHEAELALVIKGPAKMVKQKDWRSAVFGYTTLIDVSAREQGRRTWPATPLTSWLGKSFDTFAPIGPCIATADEMKDPNDLIVRFWNDGQLRHNYNTDDMEHRVPELIEWATTVMTHELRRPDRLRHQPRGTGLPPGRRDRRHRDPEHRQDDAEGRAIRSSAAGSAASTWASTPPTPTP